MGGGGKVPSFWEVLRDYREFITQLSLYIIFIPHDCSEKCVCVGGGELNFRSCWGA